jgi:hypothetical protein
MRNMRFLAVAAVLSIGIGAAHSADPKPAKKPAAPAPVPAIRTVEQSPGNAVQQAPARSAPPTLAIGSTPLDAPFATAEAAKPDTGKPNVVPKKDK